MKLRLLPSWLTQKHDPTPPPPIMVGSMQDLPAEKTTSGQFDSERIPPDIFSRLHTAESGERIDIVAADNAMYFYDSDDNEIVKVGSAIWTTTPGIHISNGVLYLTGTSGEENIILHNSIHLFEDYNDVLIEKTGLVLTSDTTDTHNVIHIKKFNGGGYDDVFKIDADGNTTINGTLTATASAATTADKVANALTAGTGLTSAGTFDGANARTFAVDLGTGATQAAYGDHDHASISGTSAGLSSLTDLMYDNETSANVNNLLIVRQVGMGDFQAEWTTLDATDIPDLSSVYAVTAHVHAATDITSGGYSGTIDNTFSSMTIANGIITAVS